MESLDHSILCIPAKVTAQTVGPCFLAAYRNPLHRRSDNDCLSPLTSTSLNWSDHAEIFLRSRASGCILFHCEVKPDTPGREDRETASTSQGHPWESQN